MSKLKDVLAAHGESVQRLGDVVVTAVEQLTELTALLQQCGIRYIPSDSVPARKANWGPDYHKWFVTNEYGEDVGAYDSLLDALRVLVGEKEAKG